MGEPPMTNEAIGGTHSVAHEGPTPVGGHAHWKYEKELDSLSACEGWNDALRLRSVGIPLPPTRGQEGHWTEILIED